MKSKDSGTEYELFVKRVYEKLFEAEGVKTISIQHDVILQGAKGEHQIDLYWEFVFAGISHRVAVECKNYKNSVSIDKIRAFHDTLDDIGGVKGVFVTTVGFQSGAKEYAKKCGISPFIIHRPSEKDWEGRIMEIRLDIKVFSVINKKMSIAINEAETKKLGINGTLRKAVNTDSLIRYDSMRVKIDLKKAEENENMICEYSSNIKKDIIKSQKTLKNIDSSGQEQIIDILQRCPIDEEGHFDIILFFEKGSIHFEGESSVSIDLPICEMHLSYDVIAEVIHTSIKADKDVLAIIKDVTKNESKIIPYTGEIVTTC